MNLKHFLIAIICLLQSLASVSLAQEIEMNKAYTIDVPFSGSNSHNISKIYFLPGATSTVVKVTNLNWGTMRIGQWGDNVLKNGVSNGVFSYELTGMELDAAKKGNVYLQCEPASDSKLTILNKDANYEAPNSGDSGGTDDSGNQGGGTGNNDNQGGDDPDAFTGSRKGGYTLAELAGQYGGVDAAKMSLIISKKRQITNLPTVYLSVPDAVGKDINSVLFKDESTGEALFHKATIKVVDDADESLEFEDVLEIKVRGNETAKGSKKPYRLKFGKDKKDANGNVIETHKHDMLGLGYAKRNWTLIANQKDGSYAHNALSYHIGKAVGMDFCPGYRFVDLVINDEYRGCYMISDHVEVGSHRIELEDEVTGWYLESNRDNQVEEPYLTSELGGGIYISIKNPEPATTDETAALKSEVSAFFTRVKSVMDQKSNPEVFCDPQNGWRAYFDEESLVKYYVGTNLTGNHDGFMTVKMSRNAGQKIKVGPLWDHDTAFGIYDDGETLAEDAQSGAPLFCNYAKAIAENDPLFVLKAHDLLHQVLDNRYMTNILQHVDDIAASVNTSQYLEAPWGNAYQVQVDELKTYINSHTDWLVETIDKRNTSLGGTYPEEDPQPEHQQLTNLPTIYLAAEAIDGDWKAASIEVFDADNKLQQGTEWSVGTAGLSIQYQGSQTAGAKDSYRLKFEDKVKLLGSTKYKQWVLASNDDDPSLMRNALAKELGDGLGLPFTPGYQFVDLYVNDTYMGTYQVTDRVKAENGRALVVGGDKDADWQVRFNDATEIAEDGLDAGDYIATGSSAAPNIIPRNPDKKDITSDAWTQLKDDMADYFQNTVFAQTDGHYTHIEENVDKEQLIQWYIAQEVLGVYKGFSSIEAYRSVTSLTDQKLHIGVIWDSEKSMGNPGEATAIDMSDLSTTSSFKGLMTNYAAYELMRNVFKDLWSQPWFANGVNNLWKDKHETLLSTLKGKTTTLKTQLAQSQAKNLQIWERSLMYNERQGFANYDDAVAAIGTYLDARFAYLTAKFQELADALPCEEHTYSNNEYAQMADKTYRLKCDKCGTAKEDGDVYYKFTVYPQDKTFTETYTNDADWASKQDVSSKPNTLFYVEAAGIKGTNVVSAGECENFVLTDATKLVIPEKFKAKNVTYVRSNVSSTWGTVCVPFKLESDENVMLYRLSAVSEDNATDGVMTFVQAEKTGGSTPLVFRKNNASATELSFTASKQEDGTVTVKATSGIEKNTSSEVPAGWKFYGNVTKNQKLQADSDLDEDGNAEVLYFISNDKFWCNTGEVSVKPFRAIFAQPKNSAASARFRITTGNADGIEQIDNDLFETPCIYDLNGRQIRSAELRPGIYVVNGEKMLVK